MRSRTSRGPGGRPSWPTTPSASEDGIDVEGVLHHPRRVARRMVERGEVVEVVLDLGAVHDAIAEADEDVLDLAAGAGDRMDVADAHGRRAGQRDVDRVRRETRVELAGLELAACGRRAPPRAPCAPCSRPSRPGRAPPRAGRRCRAGSRSARTCGPGSGRGAPRARRNRAPRRSRQRPRSSALRFDRLRSW